jgi:hypothetical protein
MRRIGWPAWSLSTIEPLFGAKPPLSTTGSISVDHERFLLRLDQPLPSPADQPSAQAMVRGAALPVSRTLPQTLRQG